MRLPSGLVLAASYAAGAVPYAQIAARLGPGVAEIVVLEAEPIGFADALRGRLRGRLPVGLDLTGTFGTAILVHAGPGVAGLAWRWRPAARAES